MKTPKGHAMNEDVMKPTAWMIRDQNGAVYWDETECVFSNKQAAEDCACGLTDGAQDGEVFSVFPLYAEPAQPVEAGDPIAWLCVATGEVWAEVDKPEDESLIAAPLYAARPSSQPAQRVESMADYSVEGFADWLNAAYSFEGNGTFTRFNMEVAYRAGMDRAALAHPRPTGDVEDQLRAILALRGYQTEGDTSDLIDRLAHMARSDRDNIEGMNSLLQVPTVEKAGEVE